MTGSSWLDWNPETDLPPERSLEDRAAIAFKVVALLNLPGIIVAPWGGPPSSLLAVTSVGAAIALTIVYVVEARGLDRGNRWAVLAARPLLVVLVAFGSYSAFVAFQLGWLKVPVDAALAIWAWLSRPRAGPGEPTGAEALGRARPRAVAIVVLVAVLQAVIWYGGPVFGWGGLLDVHPRDLTAALHVDCGPPGAGPPATLSVTYDWTWASRPPFASGLDVVVIAWRGVDGLGRVLYLLGDTPESGAGIVSGRQAFPSLELAQAVETEMPWSWHWGIQLDRQALAPGQIEFQLALTRKGPPQPGPVTIRATYIHVGVWRQDAPSVTCSW